MICPSCGNRTFKEARQCPREGGVAVCIECCKNCRYYRSDPISTPCRYYIENPTRNLEKELELLERKIKQKEDNAAYFYRMSSPGLASKEEQKLNWLYEERRKLKKEIADVNKRN